MASISGPFCILGQGKGPISLIDVGDATETSGAIAELIAQSVDDWEMIEGPTREAILQSILERHRLRRCVLDVETALSQLSDSITTELLSEAEELLQIGLSRDSVLAEILRAPFADKVDIAATVTLALANGLGAVASILERARDAQPLLRRLVDRWLAVDDQLFDGYPGGRKAVWLLAVRNRAIVAILDAESIGHFNRAWGELGLREVISTRRVVVARVGKALGSAMFPQGVQASSASRIIDSSLTDEDGHSDDKTNQSSFIAFQRATKQINSIKDAIARGEDAKATKFIRELVSTQTAQQSDSEFAVKSLCSIAKTCAELYRVDFEFECLQAALKIRPHDGWAHVQMADHLKRIRNFEQAMEHVRLAKLYAQGWITVTLEADILVQQHEYDRAMELYESIPESATDEAVRTAKADLLRRMGHLDVAEKEYQRLITSGARSHRVFAGQAEIAKRTGRLKEAKETYEGILSAKDLEDGARTVYQMALAHVLTRMQDLREAYRLVDDVVETRPFAIHARVFRAALAGLLGNANKAIADLPKIGTLRSVDEWVYEYVRGLLLLMLSRYSDAKEALFANLKTSHLDMDATGLLRLGAAVSFLRAREGVGEAAKLIAGLPTFKDTFADYVRDVLSLHVATSMNDKQAISELLTRLEAVDDADIKEAVVSLRRRDWQGAWRCEVRALLRLAA